MKIAGTVAYWIMLLAGLVGLGIQVWALIDCLIARPADFERAGKRSKSFWLAITGISVLVGVLYTVGAGFSFALLLMLAACVGAGTYLADVRPAVRQMRGGVSQGGSYQPW
ncbi:hypothetical membrane protein [Renibacterium salmoninarum ATCC 33209]|uniref:Hypothetical membrane protein n=2 Tax=Renibacterium salmoninarum TaxID=1646 RepID=A9WLX5_RENSM|nr:DUF2516 family protein [Renibacterium salmoninarum]ABQ01457.1 hypothetical membrane protein [Renibacterium salmoninarum]ABY22156.1 hypothetical membrane protein [Renibacterium salmoninarum ATCC 33209]